MIRQIFGKIEAIKNCQALLDNNNNKLQLDKQISIKHKYEHLASQRSIDNYLPEAKRHQNSS